MQRDKFVQTDPAKEFHDQIVDGTGCVHAICTDDIWMVQSHAGDGFQFHSGQHPGIKCMIRCKDLNGNFPILFWVFSDEDAPHSSEAQDFANSVAINDKASVSPLQQPLGLKRSQNPSSNQEFCCFLCRGRIRNLQLLTHFLDLRYGKQLAFFKQFKKVLCCDRNLHFCGSAKPNSTNQIRRYETTWSEYSGECTDYKVVTGIAPMTSGSAHSIDYHLQDAGKTNSAWKANFIQNPREVNSHPTPGPKVLPDWPANSLPASTLM